MMRTSPIAVSFLAAALTTGLSAPAFAMPPGHGHHGNRVPIDHCLKAAHEIKQGAFVKVEYLDPSDEGVATYEIEVRDAQGTEWEFMCNAKTGDIYEIEQEAGSASDPLFKRGAKISETQALSAVSELYKGEVEEIEYEIEANGDATYEIDVATGQSTEFKVEVDAATGKIIEVHVERWEIGQESKEKKGSQ